ncbi:MAG: CBS domain-containing protein [Deltaproteobacteria bacterium]|jgi:tRNA nucleotidyltransferase (CCA-adding enzyme)|nr:CBS domain-containing protein [Deltaproteobacteria bacterium]
MEVITTHMNADFDSLASMVAAKKFYPDAVMAFAGSQEKNIREFFVQASHYLHDFKRQKQIPLKKVTKLIVVDTRQARRLGNFAKCLKNPGIKLHLYDHHPDSPGDLKGDLEVVRPVGSTSTIFTQLFREKGIPLTGDEATLLSMGIYEDTGSFNYLTTTPEDLDAAAWLLKQGANLHTVSQSISRELNVQQLGLLNELIKSAINYTIQGIDIVVAKIDLKEYVDEFALLVRHFMVMENLNVLFALAGMEDRIYLIARSRVPEVNVGEIAMDFGGGGHASAASATLKNMTMIEAEEKLIRLLNKHVRPQSLAGELMSHPPITVPPNISIKNANQVLTRYDITVLPVVRKEFELLGIISRRVAEKAIFHNLGDLPVSDYMTTDVQTLPSSASLADIQELIIEHRQRLIPVVDTNELKGVITRTDLLNLLINDPALQPRHLIDSDERSYIERHRNVNSLIIEVLNKEVIVLLRTIGEVAEENGYTAYAVGGFVRDLLLRIKNLDLDIVIEGDGIKFAKKLAEHFGGAVRTHEKFSTALVIMPDGFNIDVATARLEYYEYPAAMPTVELSSLKLDLYRRDFTINAMAINLHPEKFGTLVDFFNCQTDIKEKRIRILHNLSFVEDPTRIFRAIRFEQRMGFAIGKHTEKLLKNAVKMNLFNRFFGHRCFTELKLIFSEENPIPAIRRMAEFNLLKFILPGLKLDKRMEKNLIETQRAMAWYKLLYLDEPCRQWLVYIFAILANSTYSDLKVFCMKFEFSPKFKKELLKEKEATDKILKELGRTRRLRPSEIYWLLQERSHESLLYIIAMARKKTAKKAVSHFVTHLRHYKTDVHGADLKKMGYKSGPIYKTILTHLLEAKLDGEVKSRSDEIEFIKRNYPLEKPVKSNQ